MKQVEEQLGMMGRLGDEEVGVSSEMITQSPKSYGIK